MPNLGHLKEPKLNTRWCMVTIWTTMSILRRERSQERAAQCIWLLACQCRRIFFTDLILRRVKCVLYQSPAALLNTAGAPPETEVSPPLLLYTGQWLKETWTSARVAQEQQKWQPTSSRESVTEILKSSSCHAAKYAFVHSVVWTTTARLQATLSNPTTANSPAPVQLLPQEALYQQKPMQTLSKSIVRNSCSRIQNNTHWAKEQW